MESLLEKVRQCTICEKHLPFAPRPIVQGNTKSKIAIIGQAPGIRVQNSGIPWDDPSGDQLRKWLGVDKQSFYNPDLFALIPMGFCYPGKGKSGDLPPRKECAPQWHQPLLSEIADIKLTLLIGKYAQDYYLGDSSLSTLTDNVRNHKKFLPKYLPLVHPSPRNRFWQAKNLWFTEEVIPYLQSIVSQYI